MADAIKATAETFVDEFYATGPHQLKQELEHLLRQGQWQPPDPGQKDPRAALLADVEEKISASTLGSE